MTSHGAAIGLDLTSSWTAIVVMPCFNEGLRLQPAAMRRFVAQHTQVRFVLVDDGSRDRTPQLLQELAERDPAHFEWLQSPQNQGQGESVRLGMARALAARPTYVGYWDADLAAPLDELLGMARVLEQDRASLCVYGARVRMLGHDIARSRSRHALGRLFANCAAFVLGLDVYDTQCGAKLFRAGEVTAALFARPFRTRWLFDVELLARLIARFGSAERASLLVRERPLDVWHEIAGSKVHATDFLRAPLQLLGIWLELRRALGRRRLGMRAATGVSPRELGSGAPDVAARR